MPFEIIRNDIVHMQVDAIVNAAGSRPVIGYGIDHEIHQKAGHQLLEARRQIGEIACGDAAITPAFQLSARYVIHAVTPVWQGGSQGECALLQSCYRKSLQLAQDHGCESIAFPLLASGNHRFPKDTALQIAVNAISQFLLQHEMQIYLVVFDRKELVLSEKLFRSVQSFIDDTYIQQKALDEYGVTDRRSHWDLETLQQRESRSRYRRKDPASLCEAQPQPYKTAPMPASPAAPRQLEDLMLEIEETFSQTLIRLIDQKGLKDPQVYKKANIDRKLFSKIKNNIDYQPSKQTAIAFAIALELSLDEARDLIGRAGYALTHSSQFDIIIEYFLIERNYNIFEINEVLFAFEQPLIGG